MDRVKRIWYLSPFRAAKVQASLRIRAVSPEPSLLAHTSSESRGTFRQKARSLAPLNGWACAVEICHDGMLEDTFAWRGPYGIAEMYISKLQGYSLKSGLCHAVFILLMQMVCRGQIWAVPSGIHPSNAYGVSRPNLGCAMRYSSFYCIWCVAAKSGLWHAVFILLMHMVCRGQIWAVPCGIHPSIAYGVSRPNLGCAMRYSSFYCIWCVAAKVLIRENFYN